MSNGGTYSNSNWQRQGLNNRIKLDKVRSKLELNYSNYYIVDINMPVINGTAEATKSWSRDCT
jgi:hypothetical protein